jgi:hypothetical protein
MRKESKLIKVAKYLQRKFSLSQNEIWEQSSNSVKLHYIGIARQVMKICREG